VDALCEIHVGDLGIALQFGEDASIDGMESVRRHIMLH
jgi:hypothetical protein